MLRTLDRRAVPSVVKSQPMSCATHKLYGNPDLMLASVIAKTVKGVHLSILSSE